MANTQKYLNHLLQNTGITPACSEEERAAANIVADIFKKHGFEPQIQEFTASSSAKIAQAAMGIMVFVGSVLMGIGGAVGFVGLALVIAGGILFGLERAGHPVLSSIGRGGLSQNVIAYHKASGPLASPRNRPVVVVAHYDSPRADLLSQAPYASYRPMLVKLLPFAMVIPAVLAVVRMFPVPDAAKTVLWVIAVVVALVPLAQSVAIIANKFILPYTSGAVCNKSSVAAMLGVMDAVAPYQGVNEFPNDVPFDAYMAEQQSFAAPEVDDEYEDEAYAEDEQLVEEPVAVAFPESTTAMPVVEEAISEGLDGQTSAMPVVESEASFDEGQDDTPVAPADSTVEMTAADLAEAGLRIHEDDPIEEFAETSESMPQEQPEDIEQPAPVEPVLPVNADGNLRFGANVIHALGMVSDACVISYDEDALPVAPEAHDVSEMQLDDDSVRDFDRDLDEDAELDEDVVEEDAYEGYEAEPIEDASESLDDETQDGPDAEPSFDEDEAYADDDDLALMEEIDHIGASDYVLEAEYEVIEDDEEEEQPEDGLSDDVDEGDADDDVMDKTLPEFDFNSTMTFEAQSSEDELQKTLAATATVEAMDEESATPEVTVGEDDQSSDLRKESEDEPEDDVEQPALDLTGATQVFEAPAANLSERTQAMPPVQTQKPVETVDSLMAQIAQPAPKPRPQRNLNIPSTNSAPRQIPNVPGIEAVPQAPVTNRAPLFDLPDPSVQPADPFASPVPTPATSAASRGFSVVGSNETAAPAPIDQGRFETITAPAPGEEKPRRGLGKLFGRKKKQQDSMSDWLGVDSDFDAKRSGGEIGSWDNFDDDGGWKGGATGVAGVTEAELRDAITSMGDDELLGHDIWFVATGASELGNAGIKAFLDEHRDKLRGVFLINLESVGAGQIAMLATEGEHRVLKGDKRIMNLVQRVSSDFHHEFGAVEMPFLDTDAYAAMSMSLRSLTLAGIDSSHFACSHTEEDQPFNVDDANVAKVADVVTEVIRRS